MAHYFGGHATDQGGNARRGQPDQSEDSRHEETVLHSRQKDKDPGREETFVRSCEKVEVA